MRQSGERQPLDETEPIDESGSMSEITRGLAPRLRWGEPAPRQYRLPSPRLALDIVTLGPIAPAPVRDFRSLDFTTLVNNPAVTISDVAWTCEVAPDSANDDPAPDRIIGDPTVAGQASTVLFGDGVDGVTYLLTATADLSDGRVLVMRGSLSVVAQVITQPQLPPGAVPFDYALFVTMFPEFQSLSAQTVYALWLNACVILRNDASSPVQDPQTRVMLLMLLTAHLAALFGGPQGGGGFGPQLGGVYTSKAVDGVSLGSSGPYPGVTGTNAWYLQTRYGQDYWMKTRALRTFHYVPGPQRFVTWPWSSWPYTVAGLY
jgi:hypothetical protein